MSSLYLSSCKTELVNSEPTDDELKLDFYLEAKNNYQKD